MLKSKLFTPDNTKPNTFLSEITQEDIVIFFAHLSRALFVGNKALI